MLSFFGESCLKDAVVARVQEHQRLDQIIQGKYWEQCADGIFRGCAIGCVLHSADHMAYERQLGLPVFLAYLDEHIFESLPQDEAKTWPLRFIEAVPVGVDLEFVYPRFMHWLLRDPQGMRQYANASTLPIIDSVVSVYAKRMEGSPFDIAAAEAAEAVGAAWAARSAAWAAEAAAWAARSAARAAEAAAWSAARAAEAAAWAARAARAAAGAARAGEAAKQSVIHRQADYLLALLASYESHPLPVSTPCEERHAWLRQPV